MSIPNVYPGPLRSVKQPGKAKTAKFHQKRRKIRKTKSHQNRFFQKYTPNSDLASTRNFVQSGPSMTSLGSNYDGFVTMYGFI